jgi:hypothetical protein
MVNIDLGPRSKVKRFLVMSCESTDTLAPHSGSATELWTDQRSAIHAIFPRGAVFDIQRASALGSGLGLSLRLRHPG